MGNVYEIIWNDDVKSVVIALDRRDEFNHQFYLKVEVFDIGIKSLGEIFIFPRVETVQIIDHGKVCDELFSLWSDELKKIR